MPMWRLLDGEAKGGPTVCVAVQRSGRLVRFASDHAADRWVRGRVHRQVEQCNSSSSRQGAVSRRISLQSVLLLQLCIKVWRDNAPNQ